LQKSKSPHDAVSLLPFKFLVFVPEKSQNKLRQNPPKEKAKIRETNG
jgi:hypothetical protein